MATSRKPNLDSLLQELVQEEIRADTPPPVPVSEAWEQVRSRLYGTGRMSGAMFPGRKKAVYAAAVLLALFAATAWLPQQGFAFARLSDIFHRIEGSVVQLFIRSGDPQPKQADTPPDDPSAANARIIEGSEIQSLHMSLEQARQAAGFPIRLPQQVPAEFTLKDVTVLKKRTEKSQEIYLNYAGSQRRFHINEKMTGPQFGAGAFVDRDDTKVEDVTVHGQKAVLLTYKNGVTELIWVTQDTYFSIEGNLTKQEILQIAESL
ncbi:DUF4367 domain-containing protein [Effusibacillus pohliae]|uniref:DUF4367 domain-containing protein n=1 Tax=Effusibacillus pohliae TaxID=232270 RepID=UPI00036AE868|nr:DUF4367 domain-containing protein [Effusibacillus pohliae]